MMDLLDKKKKIIGKWIELEKGNVQADKNAILIEHLIGNVLEKIKDDESGWDTLFKNPNDGRYWELVYLESNLHGGGPPSLVYISNEDAKIKYKI